MPKAILNVKGLHCPLPVIHTRKAMQNLSEGAVIEVHTTDPASVRDFDAYCRSTGSHLVSQRESEGVFTFEIRKGT